MATNTYMQHYANGTQKTVRRSVKQGRPIAPAELRRDCRVVASVRRGTREKLDQIIGGPLTESAVVEHALLMYFDWYAINCTVNCSKP